MSRYCRPRVFEDGRVKPDAFRLRPGEDYLSLHWLEFLGARSQADAVDQVRASMTGTGFTLGRNGCVAVLRVSQAKACVRDIAGIELILEHMPVENDPAHSGMFGSQLHELAVATELAFLVTDDDIYPARI